MRLVFVQYAGDYREAHQRFSSGGKENYYAQRYSVDFVASLARRLKAATVIAAVTDDAYDEVLDSGVRAIGAGLRPGFDVSAILDLLERVQPTHLILCTPLPSVLRWARSKNIRTMALLADSFRFTGIRSLLRNSLLARRLNSSSVEFVANHGLNACLSLKKIGVRPDKIIPWDWPRVWDSSAVPPRHLTGGKEIEALFVGQVTEAKGVGDMLEAAAIARDRGRSIRLSIVGSSDGERLLRRAEQLGLSGAVTFVGVVPNEEVVTRMRTADIVVIPSRHDCPEGLPLTIYEALAARTPIVASDHPMFQGALIHEHSALIFPAGDPERLAEAMMRLGGDEPLYASLSLNAAAALQRLRLPVEWADLITAWVSDEVEQSAWLRRHSLSSGTYDDVIARSIASPAVRQAA